MAVQEFVNDERKDEKAQAPDGGSGGIDGNGFPRADFSVDACFLFSLPLVSFDQGGTRGEDGGKGEKEAANGGSPDFGNDAGGDGDQASEEEAHEELLPGCRLQ